MNELISIVTPMYNAEKFLEETIQSVLKQVYMNWEWIIVDDCSEDNSYEIVLKHSQNDQRIKLYKLNENGGSATARNVGLSHVSGKYVTFLDADDLLDPNYLSEQLSFIKDNGPIVTASYRRLSQGNTTTFIVPNETNFKSILSGNPLSCLTTMYDFEKFKDHRFDESLQRHEDYFFWITMLKEGYIVKGNQKILATYRLNQSSKNSSKRKLVKPLFDLYHQKMSFNWLKSFIMVLRYVLYSRKKYRGVK